MQPQPWHKSIFARLLPVFLLILVPLYAGGIAIYGWGTDAVRAEISRSLASEGQAWLEGFSRDVERVRLLQYELLADPDLQDLSARAGAMPDLERTRAVNRLLKRLAALQGSSRYVSQVSVLIPAIGRTLLSRGSTTDFPAESFVRLAAEAGSKRPVLFAGGQARMTAAFPIQNLSGSRTARYLIALELSVPEIRHAVAGIDATPGRITLLTSADGLVLASGAAEDSAALGLAEALDNAAGAPGDAVLRSGGAVWLAARAEAPALGLALYRFAPESELMAPLNRYRLWFWLFTAAAVAVVAGFTVIAKRLVDQAYRQKLLAQRAELKHLQSQINPHFLYNSFFLLQNMVERGDDEGASAFTRLLGTYFQFVTRNASDEVMLEREAAHARAYAQIQARRFRGRIGVVFGELPEGLGELPVPRLILQPVIENAFEHGLEDKTSGGTLTVAFAREDGNLVAAVEDNGGLPAGGADGLNAMLLREDGAVEITALANIHRRLRLMYGPRAGMRFSQRTGGGLRAELVIPLGERRGADVPAARR